jgi:hypothetical protein
MSTTTIQEHVNEAIRDYRRSRADHALTYIKMARRFAKIPGLSKTKALEIAAHNFPGSHADFLRRQNAGESLPVLFEREGESYESRRVRAVANGGRLN